MAEAGERVDCGSLRGNFHGETGLVCLKGRHQAKEGGPEDGVPEIQGALGLRQFRLLLPLHAGSRAI